MRAWWLAPIVVRRRGILLMALLVGLACGGSIAYSVTTASDSAREAIARKTLDRRVGKLEHLTPAQVRREIARQIRRCLKDRRCRRLAARAGIAAAVQRFPNAGTPNAPGARGSPGGGGQGPGVRRPPTGNPPSPAPTPSPTTQPSPNPSPSPAPRPQPPPSAPPLIPLPDLGLPVPCVGPLHGLVCP